MLNFSRVYWKSLSSFPMLSNIISRSTAALGGALFCLSKCTALGSAGAGAGAGAAVGGVRLS